VSILLGDLEAIAGAAHGFQIARILRIGFNFFANAANVDVHGSWGDVRRIAPDGVEQMITAEDSTFVAGELVQEAKLCGGRRNGAAADGEGHGRGINLDFADGHGTGRKRAFETPEHRFDAGHELAGTEGLRDVIVGAEFQTKDAIGFAAFGSQENYRDRRKACGLANGAADFQAIFAGDHDVEKKESGALAFGIGEDGCAAGVDAHGEPFAFEMMADQSGNVGIVFEHEDAGFHEIILAERVAGT